MGAEDAFGDRPGFHQHEAQKHRIADTAPNRADGISACGDPLNEHRIDRHADEDQHTLKAHGKQGAQIILAHRAKMCIRDRDMLADLEMTLETMELGSLLGLFLQSFLIKFTMLALNIFIFVIVYGRMIEIYLLTSLAPIPVATLSNRDVYKRQPLTNLLFCNQFQSIQIFRLYILQL